MKQLIVSNKQGDVAGPSGWKSGTGEIYWTWYNEEYVDAVTLDALKAHFRHYYPFEKFEFIPDDALEQQKLPLSFE